MHPQSACLAASTAGCIAWEWDYYCILLYSPNCWSCLPLQMMNQWQVESIEESQQQISQAEEATEDESNASVRRCSHLASKSFSALSIDWPLPKLLETLYSIHSIFQLCEKIYIPAANFPPPLFSLVGNRCRRGRTSTRLPLRPMHYPSG